MFQGDGFQRDSFQPGPPISPVFSVMGPAGSPMRPPYGSFVRASAVTLLGYVTAQAKALVKPSGKVGITGHPVTLLEAFVQPSGKTALAAVTRFQVSTRDAWTGVATMTGRLADVVKALVSPRGKTGLSAVAAAMSKAQPSMAAFFALMATLRAQAKQFAPGHFVASLLSTAIAQIKAKDQPSGKTGLTAIAAAMSEAFVQPSGKTPLLSVVKFQVTARDTWTGVAAMTGRAVEILKALVSPSGAVPLTHGVGGINDARSFNGTSDFISCGNASLLNPSPPFTISLCVFYTSFTVGSDTSESWLFARDDNSLGRAYAFGLHNLPGTPELQFQYNGGGLAGGSGALSTNTWYRLTVTVTGSATQLYLDGSTNGTAGSGVTHVSATGNTTIGERTYSGFQGRQECSIADVALWDIELTPTQVASLGTGLSPVRANTIGANANLIGYWPMVGESPETDESGNGNNGTLTGTVVVAGPFLAPYGSIAIRIAQTMGQANLIVFFALMAVTRTQAKQFAPGNFVASVLSRTAAQIKAKDQPSGTLTLSGLTALQNKTFSKTPFIGILLSGLSALQAKARAAQYVGTAILSALGASKLKSSVLPSGKVGLAALAKAQSAARGLPIRALFLLGSAATAVKSSSQSTVKASLSALSATRAMMRPAFTGSAAAMARMAIRAAARGKTTGVGALAAATELSTKLRSAVPQGTVALLAQLSVISTITLENSRGLLLSASLALRSSLSGAAQVIAKLFVNSKYITAPLFYFFPARNFITFPQTPIPSMPQGVDFSPCDPGEIITCTFDFAPWMSAGASIASITSVTCGVVRGIDSNPSSHLVGSPQLGFSPSTGANNSAVLQQWGTLLSNVYYRFTATIITTDGQTLILWAHQQCGAQN